MRLTTLHNIMDFQSIIKYNSDSNGQHERFDLGKQEKFDKNIPLNDILRIAIERKASLISRTSYISEEKPGAWYIKGWQQKISYNDIKRRIEENVELGKHTKRICYLIKYD
jgi:hypothetical protein